MYNLRPNDVLNKVTFGRDLAPRIIAQNVMHLLPPKLNNSSLTKLFQSVFKAFRNQSHAANFLN